MGLTNNLKNTRMKEKIVKRKKPKTVGGKTNGNVNKLFKRIKDRKS